MTTVLVSHPHAAAFAVEVAGALERSAALARFFTGFAAVRGDVRGRLIELAAEWRPVVANRLLGCVSSPHLGSLAAVELLARGVGRLAGATRGRFRSYDALFVLHDAAVAALPWPADARTVYGYEDGALFTFRRAAKSGLRRVLDLPLPWWRTVEEMWIRESERWPGAMGERPPVEPAWKKRRKDAELAFSEAVSVASSFTRESLERVGYDRRILTTPYPFPADRFRPRPSPPGGPFTVLSVGTQDLRKGTPYLLEAWRRAGLRDAKLKLVGRLRLTPGFLGPYAGMFEHVPALPKTLLEPEYQAADLLAFPTLCDGFGLVMQEAMCCGTPVVTTRCGGGPECITTGEDGLIVEERSVDALVEVLRWAAANRDRLHGMGIAARRRAERYVSEDFGRRFVSGLLSAID